MNEVLAIDFAAFGQWIGGILLAVLILLAMITIHEFGHYLSGKLLNFRITEFSIGFGPAIFKKRSKKSGELFAVRIIPLGGYCAFDGEDYEEDDPRSDLTEGESTPTPAPTQEEEYPQPKGERFNDQAPWKRIIVLVSGALMNYLLALVLLLIMCFSYGVPMCITVPVGYKGEKLTPAAWETPTVQALDILVSIEGREIDMYTDCMDALAGKKAGDSVSVVVYRLYEETVDGKPVRGWREKEVSLTLLADADFSNSAEMEKLEKSIGLSIGTNSVKRDFWHTVGGAFEYSGEMATSVLRTLGELITGAFGDKTADVVGGPISMIGQTAQAASASPFSFLYIASFIGVNLAVFNLLPVPALDGCKVIFCIIEWIRKKPVNRKVEAIINFAGIVVLFGFAILIDLLKLF